MAKPLSDVQRDFIIANYKKLGPAEVARQAGCAKQTAINIWHRDGGKPEQTEPVVTTDAPKSQLERLKEARDSLRLAMLDAPPQAVAGIVREYRATLGQIDNLEGGDGDDEASKAIAAIAESIAKAMPTAT